MAKPKMRSLGISDDHLKSMAEGALLERERLHFEIKELTTRKDKVTEHILSLIGMYPDFWRESQAAKQLINEHPFLKFMVDSNAEPTIGDAAYSILKERGTLTKKELLEELAAFGISISEKNSSTVLGTALKRDTQRRFVTMKDGRVILAKGRK